MMPSAEPSDCGSGSVSVGLVRVIGADRWEIHVGDYNVGLLYLADAAEAQGASVRIYDPFDSTMPTEAIIRSLGHTIIGFTLHHLNVDETLTVVRTLKRVRPSVFILLGGHHAAASADDLLRDVPEIDAVCCTGGESVIAGLVRAFRTGADKPSQHRGVLMGHEVEDLDGLPIPRTPSTGAVARVCTSRGCPFRCNFCTTPGMRKLWNEPTYRSRRPESIVEEFERLYQHGFTDIRVNDDLFIVPSPESRQRAARIAELVTARKLPVRYKVEYRCDSIPANGITFLRMLRASGLREVFLGVESGSKRILQEYRKSLAFNTSIAAVKMHADAGIVINAGNILASPDSTTEDIVQSIEGFAELGMAYLLFRRTNFRAHVFPGTGMEESLRKSGRLVGVARYGPLSYAFIEPRIEDVVNLLEAAMPAFLVRTRGEMFTGRKAALHAVYDGALGQDAVLPILAEMNERSTAFLLRWFRDLPPVKITEARLGSEMDEFTEQCCRWGQQLMGAAASAGHSLQQHP